MESLWTRLPTQEKRWLIEHLLMLRPVPPYTPPTTLPPLPSPGPSLALYARLKRYGASSSPLSRYLPDPLTLTDVNEMLSANELKKLESLLTCRIVHRKPLQYILQWVPFLGAPTATRKPILIPRWETEELCDRLVESVLAPALKKRIEKKEPLRILDACSGSGCISIGIAHRLLEDFKSRDGKEPSVEVLGIDNSPSAIRLARFNLRLYQRLQQDNVMRTKWNLPVSFHQIDLFQPDIITQFRGKFDVIVSNPPYIPLDQYANLEPDVKNWESPSALATVDNASLDPHGIRFHERLLEIAPILFGEREGLRMLAMETNGDEQVKVLEEKIGKEGTGREVEVWRDMEGVKRFLLVRF